MEPQLDAPNETVRKINILCAMIGVGSSVLMATRSSKVAFMNTMNIALADLLLCLSIVYVYDPFHPVKNIPIVMFTDE